MQVAPFQLQLIHETEWKSLFSRNDYDKTKNKDSSLSPEKATLIRNHSLKYLIVFDEPVAKIIEFIHSLKKKNSPQLSSSLTHYQLTPLLIAVMKDKLQVAQALIETTPAGSQERKALLEARDCYGWTALHHAALKVDAKMMSVLLAAGADSKSLTPLGATYDHLRMMVRLKSATSSYASLDYCSLGGTPQHLPIEQFQRLTRLQTYSDQPLYSLSNLLSLWKTSPHKMEAGKFSQEKFSHIYQGMLEKPAQLVVKEESSQAFGLYAGQDLNFAQVIIEYAGEVVGERYVPFIKELEGQNSAYQFKDVDAIRIGNAARFANDGYPNVGVLPIYNVAGRVARYILFVLNQNGIKKGEAICLDYLVGEPKLKWKSPYYLGRHEAMHADFTESSVNQLLEKYQKRDDVLIKINKEREIFLEDLIPHYEIDAKIKYLYTTPAALINLVCHNLVQLNELKSIFNTPSLNGLRQQGPTHMQWISQLIDLMQSFKDLLEPLDTYRKQEILAFIIGNQGKMTTLQIIRGIQVIEQWLKDAHASSSESASAPMSWAALKESLMQSLPLYQKYPFSVGTSPQEEWV